MALVLNGSNDTITGLQINSANIVDGSISNADLASGVGGKVLQAVSATSTTKISNTTETFADTGLTATISISSGSKVLILASHQLDISRSSTTESRGSVKLLRGSTDIFAPQNNKAFGLQTASASLALFMTMTFAFLDTGASTGSNTYKTQFRVSGASNGHKIRMNDDNSPSTITLLEVAA